MSFCLRELFIDALVAIARCTNRRGLREFAQKLIEHHRAIIREELSPLFAYSSTSTEDKFYKEINFHCKCCFVWF